MSKPKGLQVEKEVNLKVNKGGSMSNDRPDLEDKLIKELYFVRLNNGRGGSMEIARHIVKLEAENKELAKALRISRGK